MRPLPPILALLYLFVALGLHYLLPSMKIISSPYRFLGIVLVAGALSLIGWAVRVFEQHGTTHKIHETPTVLVVTGPYRVSRNPMYVGISCILLGIAGFVGTLPVFLAPLAFLLTMNAVCIPREERTLERIFGQAYLDYTDRVRRWL